MAGRRAHARTQESLLGGTGRRVSPRSGLRGLVRASWERCRALGVDPESAPPVLLVDGELGAAREASPLALAMPVVRALLVEHAVADDLVVAVSDAQGRLLWVEGAQGPRARCEAMHFQPGARWDERSAGTNAPGTALTLDAAVSVRSGEHWGVAAQPWSCSAAPVHDPRTGQLLGALDLTGDERAAAPAALALVRATVAAVERELLLRSQGRAVLAPAQLGGLYVVSPRAAGSQERADPVVLLDALGPAATVTVPGEAPRPLSLRHAELLVLLAEHPEGLSGDALAVGLAEHELDPVTVRAEVSRLRRVLAPVVLHARPYRLALPVVGPAQQVRACLDRGDVAAALTTYALRLLPGSDAPGVVGLRGQLEAQLRGAALGSGDPAVLQACAQGPAGEDDARTWQAYAAALPPGAARGRARAVGALAGA